MSDSINMTREQRAALLDRIDVLNKVKALMLMPGIMMVTVRQLAEYFEESPDNIHKEEGFMMCKDRRRGKPFYKRCAFTGYRPQKMPFGFNEADPRCVEFKARLLDTIEGLIGKGYVHFISGGAMGMIPARYYL